jgi:hypothetical protein
MDWWCLMKVTEGCFCPKWRRSMAWTGSSSWRKRAGKRNCRERRGNGHLRESTDSLAMCFLKRNVQEQISGVVNGLFEREACGCEGGGLLQQSRMWKLFQFYVIASIDFQGTVSNEYRRSVRAFVNNDTFADDFARQVLPAVLGVCTAKTV